MRHFFKATIIISVLIFSSCSNQLAEYMSKGDTAYATQNYELALFNWDKIIVEKESRNKAVSADLYAKAGCAALSFRQMSKAERYLKKAQTAGLETPEVLSGLAEIYNTKDNLSYELSNLEKLVQLHPNDSGFTSAQTRLFDVYVRSENWEKAVQLWPAIETGKKTSSELLNGWFEVQKALNNDTLCNQISNTILTKDSKHLPSLEWQAKTYYQKAEQLYHKEMSAYNAKKTRKQYAILLTSLKIATADFKISRDYFESAYQLSKDKAYAVYLSNIYARLNNSKQSAYYKRLSK